MIQTRLGEWGDDGAEIERDELAYVRERRSAAHIPSNAPAVGLALSGGGIRSATISLGVLKSLSRLGLLRWFDYMSTVSGGGYTGAFYGRLITSTSGRPDAPPPDLDDPLGTSVGEAAVRHLRNNGRYLLPNGAGDAVRLATTAVRGWLAIQLVIGLTLLAFLLTLKAVQASLLRWTAVNGVEAWLADRGWSPWWSPLEWLRGYPLGDYLMLSALWIVPAIGVLIAAATGWGYWLARYDTVPLYRPVRLLGPSGIGALGIAAISLVPIADGDLRTAVRFIGGLAVAAVLSYLAAEWRAATGERVAGSDVPSPTLAERREQEDRVRNLLTRWTSASIAFSIALSVLAAIDTAGQSIYSLYLQEDRPGIVAPLTGATIVLALIPVIRRVVAWVQGAGPMGDLLRKFGRILALAVAILVALALASFWAVLAEYLAWRGGAIGGEPNLLRAPDEDIWSLASVWALAAVFLLVACGIGLSIGFLNLSSFSAFYSGRLRRAYLGASNPDRIAGGVAADREVPGDDVQLAEYYRPASGAPLHLINVTINETEGEGSSVVQRDRKGRPMTISSAGYLIPTVERARNRMTFDAPGRNGGSSGAELPLSNWIAISGAAMSTGLGQNTSLGVSLLAGLSNLRLGVWWTPPGRRGLRLLDPREWVQRYLAAEFLARFTGIFGRRWYLTDGGHFENTGIYELVRRRVPLIVACDNGADPDYDFGDVVNLTRKLRVDFGADLDFLPAGRLDDLLGADSPSRPIFGELSELVRLSRERSSRGPYAAIGRIRVAGEPYLGTLILLKPRLSGLEMVDLLDYNRANPDFPQQTTGDQFFDEAQWESYFRLGATIAELAFSTETAGAPRQARRMDPIPPQEEQQQTGDPPTGPPPKTWVPGALMPISSDDFEWFGKEWFGVSFRKPDAVSTPPPPPPPAGASGPAPTGDLLATTAARVGTGRLMAGAVAALGTVGLASGIGSGLAGGQSVPQDPPASVRNEAVGAPGAAVPPNDTAGGSGKADTDARLGEAIDRLNALIDSMPLRQDPTAATQLIALRASFDRYAESREPDLLPGMIKELDELRQFLGGRDDKLDNSLKNIDRQLGILAQQVRDAGPRRNVRGN
ncbi:hypothetical protein [Sphingomonas sp.]|jgi:hypothetical protein|uniref:Yip1 family protein n=1 Tax=Sphingomonas sp. TaxID=28214 RepID=UPI002DF5DD46|nr:hypothetical protein [Sphingomonas sp.]